MKITITLKIQECENTIYLLRKEAKYRRQTGDEIGYKYFLALSRKLQTQLAKQFHTAK